MFKVLQLSWEMKKTHLTGFRMPVSFDRRISTGQNKISGDASKWLIRGIPSVNACECPII